MEEATCNYLNSTLELLIVFWLKLCIDFYWYKHTNYVVLIELIWVLKSAVHAPMCVTYLQHYNIQLTSPQVAGVLICLSVHPQIPNVTSSISLIPNPWLGQILSSPIWWKNSSSSSVKTVAETTSVQEAQCLDDALLKQLGSLSQQRVWRG